MRLVSLLFHDVYDTTPDESGFRGGVADSYKLPAAEMARALLALSAASPSLITLASPADLEQAAGLTLTVDDGGVSYERIADALEAYGWRGHCFITTNMIGRLGFLTALSLRRLDQRGHVIGSHSASHPTRFSACAWPRALEEWRRSRAALEDILGHEVRVASLPGGYLSEQVARAAAEAGLRLLFTSEPVAHPWRIGECVLLGRFTIRPGQPASDLAALARGARLPLFRQRIAWTAKKFVKPWLGPIYPWLGEWAARRSNSNRGVPQ